MPSRRSLLHAESCNECQQTSDYKRVITFLALIVSLCSHVSGMIVSYLGHIDYFSNSVKRYAGKEERGRGRARKRGEKGKGKNS